MTYFVLAQISHAEIKLRQLDAAPSPWFWIDFRARGKQDFLQILLFCGGE
jgi:hypothetical protein